ncbi:MAG: hypothetical protein HYX86_04290 [Chloroflexi bacterium]|nr:hypothetical protein [Chloroflexota bacterium]
MMPILFLLFSQSAIGGLALLWLAPQSAGRTFFRMMGAIFLFLSILGLMAAMGGGLATEFILFLPFSISLLIYEIFFWRGIDRIAPILYMLTLALGLLSLFAVSVEYSAFRAGIPGFLYPLNFLGTAVILGSVIVGLALGHWYLAAYKMPLEPLKRVVQILIISALGLGILNIWLALSGSGLPLDATTSPESTQQLILILGRVVFGILAPAFLGLMTWDVLRYRKTTSATGILYVALALVIAGELSARFLLLATGIPW